MNNSVYFEAQQAYAIRGYILSSAKLIEDNFGKLDGEKGEIGKTALGIMTDWVIYLISHKDRESAFGSSLLLGDVDPKIGSKSFFALKNSVAWFYGNVDETTFNKFYSEVRKKLFRTVQICRAQLEVDDFTNVRVKFEDRKAKFSFFYTAKTFSRKSRKKTKFTSYSEEERFRKLISSKKVRLFESIPVSTYNRLKDSLEGFSFREINNIIFSLVHRYGIFMERKEEILDKNLDGDDDTLELFGNGIYTTSANFCSIFPDLEQFLGSLGSSLTLPEGQIRNFKRVVAEPPQVEAVLEDTAQLLVDLAKNTKIEITAVIPNWKPGPDNSTPYPTYSKLEPYIKSEEEDKGNLIITI